MLSFESLIVYQKAFFVNHKIYHLLKQNRSIPPYMKNQLGRAALSIMLNIAEGTSKTSSRERCNFFTIARGSAFESASILQFLIKEQEFPEKDIMPVLNIIEEISKMLFTMNKKLRSNQ